MKTSNSNEKIRWKLHLQSPPEIVYYHLTTDEGRMKFWAEKSRERDNKIEFTFSNGQMHTATILSSTSNKSYELEYFDSRVSFELVRDPFNGTELTMVNHEVPASEFHNHYAGWVSVLLALKGAVDFGVDLRNHDKSMTWDDLFVDN